MGSLRTLLPYMRPYRRGIALGLVMVALAQGFQTAGPWVLKVAIDGMRDPEVTQEAIALYAMAVVGVALLGGAARFGMRQLLNSLSRRIEVDLRNDFFAHLLRLDASFYAENRTGDLMSRAGNDTLAVRQAAGPAIMYSVNTAVGFAMALALMLWISPRLTGLALIPMLLLPPVVIGFGRVIHARFQEIQEHYSTLSTMVQENLTGMRIVRAYTREAEQAVEFDRLNEEYRRRNMALVTRAGLFRPLMGLLSGLAMVVVLYLGGLEAMAGNITVGEYVAFFFYVALLTWPMIALGWVTNLFQRGAASMSRINAIMEREPRIRPPEAEVSPDAAGGGESAPKLPADAAPAVRSTPHPVQGIRGRIEFRDVSFRYPNTRRAVLEGISFVARPGETVAIVGATGAGKSTLVSLVPRLHDPTAGEILLDGVPLHCFDPRELRSVMGIVPQDSFLFSDTLRANIALGLPDDRVEPAARVAQLHEAVQDFPRGYDTLLGERGINLSGGQKQRTALARAVARDPVILILDDALSAVDTSTEAKILEDLRTVMRQRTSFIISHRVSAVMDADRILVMDDGRIVERGTHEELAAAGGEYAALLHRQMLESQVEGAGLTPR
jgi:ATP-binding cassette subfamily B protein